MKADPKLRVVLKDFPVLGPDSVEASRVALAVKNQLKGDKLFDYHVKLMETRGRVNGERAIAVAKEMGVDMARLQKDMEAAEVRAAIQENVALGDKLGLTGTPAFIVGDEVISGRRRARAAAARPSPACASAARRLLSAKAAPSRAALAPPTSAGLRSEDAGRAPSACTGLRLRRRAGAASRSVRSALTR